MKIGDIVKSNLPYTKQFTLGVVLSIHSFGNNKYSAEVYWDDNSIRGTMTKYLEIVCKSEL